MTVFIVLDRLVALGVLSTVMLEARFELELRGEAGIRPESLAQSQAVIYLHPLLLGFKSFFEVFKDYFLDKSAVLLRFLYVLHAIPLFNQFLLVRCLLLI